MMENQIICNQNVYIIFLLTKSSKHNKQMLGLEMVNLLTYLDESLACILCKYKSDFVILGNAFLV